MIKEAVRGFGGDIRPGIRPRRRPPLWLAARRARADERDRRGDRPAREGAADLEKTPGLKSRGSIRTDGVARVATDAYFQATPTTELYSRIGLLRADVGYLGTAVTYLWQGRVQQHLGRRFDVAFESRWVHRPTNADSRRLIYAGELGMWLTRDLRIAAGYTTQPWTETGPTLATTTGRGGPYFVLSSRLSSLFDLFSRIRVQ